MHQVCLKHITAEEIPPNLAFGRKFNHACQFFYVNSARAHIHVMNTEFPFSLIVHCESSSLLIKPSENHISYEELGITFYRLQVRVVMYLLNACLANQFLVDVN
jgi:hypothetical protein